MRISICKWFYIIQSVILLMVLLAPFSQAKDYKYDRSCLGIRGAIGGVVSLPRIEQYAIACGYKNIKMPFCNLDLEGALHLETRMFKIISLRYEFGPRYVYGSFTGVQDSNKIKQSIGWYYYGGHLSLLTYFYPCGRFTDNGSWNGHIGIRISSEKLKGVTRTKIKADHSIFIFPPFILGVGLEFISGLQLDCRYYSWLPFLFAKEYWLISPNKNPRHALSLGIGYRFY